MKITWNLTLVNCHDVDSIQKRLQTKRVGKQGALMRMSCSEHPSHGDFVIEILMCRYAIFGKYSTHFIAYRSSRTIGMNIVALQIRERDKRLRSQMASLRNANNKLMRYNRLEMQPGFVFFSGSEDHIVGVVFQSLYKGQREVLGHLDLYAISGNCHDRRG